MARPFTKVAQPPIDRSRRPAESRPAWIGAALAGAAVVLIAMGAVRLSPVGDGVEPMSEPGIVGAIRRGGLKPPPADRPAATDLAGDAATPEVADQGVEERPDFCPT